MKGKANDLYHEIDAHLDPLRKLTSKDQRSIIDVLAHQGIPYPDKHFEQYFIEYKLLKELEQPHITSIETLLKVAQLYHHIRTNRKEAYKTIRTIANAIYYNDGKNGILFANSKIDPVRFRDYICSFDCVFTTNFDNLLDDVYDREVYHLHGGFNYKREYLSNGDINIVKKRVEPYEAHLVWGIDSKEKKKQTEGRFRYPIAYPRSMGWSVLTSYYQQLYGGTFGELYIWGYSGLNDGHINNHIGSNKNIFQIIYYCDPDKVNDVSEKAELIDLFSPSSPDRIHLSTWDDAWQEVISR